ncbi:unnamed protein product [Oikopleura dioica]|uniref:Uncharacterized protein n=1 Tax=Oikopleura dioica TaxID=34765 RepID=E4YAB6_OIKDI|nr:unnamed protein product [Oikopleura dioica]
MSRLHFSDFSGTEIDRNVNIGRRQGTDRNEFLSKRQQERERRAQERKNEKSAIIIQAAWRSLVSRRRTFKRLEENLSHRLASSSLANNHRMAVSHFLVSSRCMTPDGYISTLVGILARQQEAKAISSLSDSSISIGFLIIEILKHVNFLCGEAAPRIGPGLRVLEKLIVSRPESILDAIQFGMFRLLASIQLLLLPSDTTDLTRCPPRVVAITEIILKTLNAVITSRRSAIGIKCFLRDYIGSSETAFLSSQIATAIKEDARLSGFILKAIESFVLEKATIVSFSQETSVFGDFSRKKLVHFNDPRFVPVFPDSEFLYFLLTIAKDTNSPASSILKSICWCSKSAIKTQVSTDVFDMEDDDDWLDEDEDEFDNDVAFVSTLNEREQELRNFLASYFTTLDFDSIDSELIVEVVKLITSLNDSSLYLKVSSNTGFLRALWAKIQGMESSLGAPVCDRLIAFRPVSEDDFNDFSSLVHYFSSTIRLQLIALSDDDLKNNKFLVPAISLTAFTLFFCRLPRFNSEWL